MVVSNKDSSPLTKEQIIKIKYSLEPFENRVVEENNYRILCIRSPNELPDIVNDLESVVEKLDKESTENISHAILIGGEEVVGIDLGAIGAVMSKRREHDEEIIKELKEKLQRDFGTVLFQSEMDPSSILRLGIRVPMTLEELEEKGHSSILGGLDLPQDSEVIYLIGDDEGTRLSGNSFYSKLSKISQEDISRIVDDDVPVEDEGLPLPIDEELPKLERASLSESIFDDGPKSTAKVATPKGDKKMEPTPPPKSITPDSSLLDSAAERIHKSLSVSLEESLSRIRSSLDSLVLEPLSSKKETPAISKPRPKRAVDLEPEMDFESVRAADEKKVQKESRSPKIEDIKPHYSDEDIYGQIKNTLVKNGFDISEETLIDSIDIVARFPDSDEELLVRFLKHCGIKDAFSINRITENRKGSWGALVAETIEKDVEIFAIGKRFKVFSTNIFLSLIHLQETIRE